MTIMLIIANSVSAVAAFTAAALWWRASRTSVAPEKTPPGVPIMELVTSNGTRLNPLATALESSRLNVKAAIAAGGGSMFSRHRSIAHNGRLLTTAV